MIWLRNIVLVAILAHITYTDIKRHEIENEPLIVGLIFIILFSLCGLNDVPFKSSVAGFLLGGVFFTILAFWGMGGGDIKLMAVIGFFVGVKSTLLVMYLSFLFGAIIGVICIVTKKKGVKDYIAFGPAIALATILVVFFSPWLTSNIGLFQFFR